MAGLELAFPGRSPGKLSEKEHAEDPRRDEWSVDAISSLLDLYEARWNLRNRGNLKGRDWEDVAAGVSSRCGGGRPSKTSFQCKNKVASMKQKYRSESLLVGISGASSRWHFFARIDQMLRSGPLAGREAIPVDGLLAAVEAGVQVAATELRFQEAECWDSVRDAIEREQSLHLSAFPQDRAESMGAIDQHRDSNKDDASNTLPQRVQESDTSTQRNRGTHVPGISGKHSEKPRGCVSREVADSIRAITDCILRLEQTKMEMLKGSERLRVELEARRADMELRRTEIIMSTQLQIARLLSKSSRKRKSSGAAKGRPALPSAAPDSALCASRRRIPCESTPNTDVSKPVQAIL